jgi:putative ABC transport system ATP-binding protein
MIHLSNIQFAYPHQEFSLKLKELRLEPEKSYAITGPSGTGKSTFLKLISGELTPQVGEVRILENETHKMSDFERRLFRLKNIGIVFQNSQLLDYLTIRENILLPVHLNGSPKTHEVDTLIEKCSLTKLLNRKPQGISEGEKQRVAVCRALITDPAIILADEPTSSLDPKNSQIVMELLVQACRQKSKTLITVTHDRSLLTYFDEVIDLSELEITS